MRQLPATRRVWGLAMLAAAFGCVTSMPAAAKPPVPAVIFPTVTPDFTLRAAGGGNYRLSEYRGEVVELVFSATWCGNCRAALELAQKHSATYGASGLQVLVISLDEQPVAAREFAEAAGVALPVLIDADKSVSRAFRADSLPLAVLIDRGGVVRSRNGLGDQRAEQQLVSDIRALLDE